MSKNYIVVGDKIVFSAGADLNLNQNSILDEEQPDWWRELRKGYIHTIVLEDGIVDIPDLAFCTLRTLESVELPNTLVRIGECAFANCTALKSICIPDSVREIGECAFDGSGLLSLKIPSTVEKIGKYAFKSCDNLKSAEVGAVKVLPEGLFSCCMSLDSVILSDGTVEIGDGAFECTALDCISIPGSVKKFGSYFVDDGVVVLTA